jgi:hypothetical protein
LALGSPSNVASRRGAGRCGPLFPDVKAGASGYFSDPFSKWFARQLRAAGIKEPAICFHSFRHTFRDALRAGGVGEEKAKAICGWADDSLASHYGRGFGAEVLKAEIDRVAYPGLDLSGLIAAADTVGRAAGRPARTARDRPRRPALAAGPNPSAALCRA